MKRNWREIDPLPSKNNEYANVKAHCGRGRPSFSAIFLFFELFQK